MSRTGWTVREAYALAMAGLDAEQAAGWSAGARRKDVLHLRTGVTAGSIRG